jgi:hypothetical protein
LIAKIHLLAIAMGNRNITAPEVGANYGKQLCYIVFDVLFVNDRPVMDLTLDQRMKILERVIPSTRPKTLEIVEQRRAKNVQEVIEALDNAIEARQEGIMVKKVDSIYVPNERKEKWIKIKPEYMDGVGDDMDMIILGGYYGSGVRKGGTISHFLMGVKKSANLYVISHTTLFPMDFVLNFAAQPVDFTLCVESEVDTAIKSLNRSKSFFSHIGETGTLKTHLRACPCKELSSRRSPTSGSSPRSTQI